MGILASLGAGANSKLASVLPPNIYFCGALANSKSQIKGQIEEVQNMLKCFGKTNQKAKIHPEM